MEDVPTRVEVKTSWTSPRCRRVAAAAPTRRHNRYLRRPENDWTRFLALGVLANHMDDYDAKTALSMHETRATLLQRFWPYDQDSLLTTQCNVANCLCALGRLDDMLHVDRKAYADAQILYGRTNERTILIGDNLTTALSKCKLFAEAKLSAREIFGLAQQSLPETHFARIGAAKRLAEAVIKDPDSGYVDWVEAEALYAGVVPMARRVFGPEHPETRDIVHNFEVVRGALARLQRSPG